MKIFQHVQQLCALTEKKNQTDFIYIYEKKNSIDS